MNKLDDYLEKRAKRVFLQRLAQRAKTYAKRGAIIGGAGAAGATAYGIYKRKNKEPKE